MKRFLAWNVLARNRAKMAKNLNEELPMDDATQNVADSFRTQIRGWYGEYKRTLPWRGLRSFYPVWVSEIMCQQTQVATVIPYFERWMETLPDVESLASATEEEVLKLWEGLGYYRRARLLQKGALFIKDNGEPETFVEMLKVPGIGPYTAGAIASIVFDEKVPAVDGNVLRVISRFRAIFEPVDTKVGRSVIEQFVEKTLISETCPGSLNQSIMELGALICRPKVPRCEVCPLKGECLAFLEHVPTDLPIKSKKVKAKKWSPFAVIYRKGDKIALKREEDKNLLSGLWGVPIVEEKPEDVDELVVVRHQFTHRDTYYQVCVSDETAEMDYFSSEELKALPISTAMKKVISAYFSNGDIGDS